MLIKILLAIVITLIFKFRSQVGFKAKIFFHPILLGPAMGLLLSPYALNLSDGALSTGITIGVLTELLWGSNLVDFTAGLESGLLACLLTIPLVALTGTMNLIFPLSLVVLLVYSFQESLGYFSSQKWYIYIVALFNLMVLLSAPLLQNILGWVPAGILDNLALAGGLLPAVALGFIFVQGVFPIFKRDNIWYYSYLLATLLISVLMINGEAWASIFFPLCWYSIYYLWNQTKDIKFKKYFRISIAVIVVIIATLFMKFSSPYVTSDIQYVLWVEALVALFAVLRFFKLTVIEGYFIMLLLGIIGANFGVFN
jgi:PTS system mannose-specific IIC component